jgi:hypothetical protein
MHEIYCAGERAAEGMSMHTVKAGIIFSLILVPVFTGTPRLLPHPPLIPPLLRGDGGGVLAIGKKIRSKTIPALAALSGVIILARL